MDSDYPLEGSPADRRRQKVRESILAAAERVFACEGENGLSIRRLAEEIDYSPSAIYKYFGSKEELLEELKEAFFERLLVAVDRVQKSGRSFLDCSAGCLKAYVETATARPHHYAAAFSSIPAQDEQAPRTRTWEDFMNSQKGRAFHVLIDMVQQGKANGTFDPALDPIIAAKSVWASCHGLALLLIHLPAFETVQPDGISTSREASVDFHIQTILRGLRAPAAPTPSSICGTGT
ncbi:MAG: TetR/AcrR family transcriptional regulator [Hyphomonas sp.]|nr:TetR/AcrR family transcriptional regulator [Hyphomonas sp.]